MNINAKVTGIHDLTRMTRSCTRVTLRTDDELPVEIQIDFQPDDPRLDEFRTYHAWVRLRTEVIKWRTP